MTVNDSPDDRSTELVLTQRVEAPVADVWAAWITADGLARWWWPHWPDTEYVLEARAGGHWSARSEQGGTGVEGEVLWLDEPHGLELTWRWDGANVEDLVRVQLAESDGATSVTVRHRTTGSEMDDYRQGWEFVLSNLRDTADANSRADAPE